jgi:hypothetical protein
MYTLTYVIAHQLPISTTLLYTEKHKNLTQKQLPHITIMLFDQKVNKDSLDINKVNKDCFHTPRVSFFFLQLNILFSTYNFVESLLFKRKPSLNHLNIIGSI